jgi:hypothetical protein
MRRKTPNNPAIATLGAIDRQGFFKICSTDKANTFRSGDSFRKEVFGERNETKTEFGNMRDEAAIIEARPGQSGSL